MARSSSELRNASRSNAAIAVNQARQATTAHQASGDPLHSLGALGRDDQSVPVDLPGPPRPRVQLKQSIATSQGQGSFCGKRRPEGGCPPLQAGGLRCCRRASVYIRRLQQAVIFGWLLAWRSWHLRALRPVCARPAMPVVAVGRSSAFGSSRGWDCSGRSWRPGTRRNCARCTRPRRSWSLGTCR